MTRTVAVIAGILTGLATSAAIVATLAQPRLPPLAQGLAAEERGDLVAARAIYETVAKEPGPSIPGVEARRRLAVIRRSNGELGAAVDLMTEVCQHPSATPTDLLTLGDLQVANRALPDAVSTWSRLSQWDGAALEWRLEAARRLVDVGSDREARAAFEGLAATELKVTALTELAILDVYQGRYSDAADRLDGARSGETTSPAVAATEGILALAMGDLGEADRALGEALAKEPRQLHANLARARLLALRHEEAEAIRQLTPLLKPTDPAVRLRLTLAQLSAATAVRGKPATLAPAKERCDELEELAPGHPLTFQCLAILAMAQGEPGQAQRLLSGVLEMAPGDVDAAVMLVNATARLGDDKRAVEVAEDALKRWPGHLGVRTRRDLALGRVDRGDEAASDLVLLVSEFPSYWPAQVALGEVQMANDHLRHAESAFREALKIAPRAFEARYGLSELYASRDQLRPARDECEAVLAQRPGDPRALVHLAGLEALAGQESEALKHAIEAREGGANPEDFQGVPGLELLAEIPEYARLVSGGG